jgi:uncharacterized protein (TIGR02646 family)
MRRIVRLALPEESESFLRSEQDAADEKRRCGELEIAVEWKRSRALVSFRAIVSVLRQMAGDTERCMYCSNYEGSDIEHFRPKSRYPDFLFVWDNYLLCCPPCGRAKGNQFPTTNEGEPLLLNPTVDTPWDHLDFDPLTGNIVARWDATTSAENPKGKETVQVLGLSRREGLGNSLRRSFLRVEAVLKQASGEVQVDFAKLETNLRSADDCGLLEWFFRTPRMALPLLEEFYSKHPTLWERCVDAFSVDANPQ